MKIFLIAVGKRMPDWVKEGFETYAKRFPSEISLEIKEIGLEKRHKGKPVHQIVQQEGQALISAIVPGSLVIALDEHGEHWDTKKLSNQLQVWKDEGQTISFLIGGPDGLSEDCLSVASKKWSLSKLTFPHPLVRIIVAEQIYRAWTILSKHPYHRD